MKVMKAKQILMLKTDENFTETQFQPWHCSDFQQDTVFTLMFTFLILRTYGVLGHITSGVYASDKQSKDAITPRYWPISNIKSENKHLFWFHQETIINWGCRQEVIIIKYCLVKISNFNAEPCIKVVVLIKTKLKVTFTVFLPAKTGW